MANIIEKIQKPTLVLAHNKTLAGQLYSEFKEFFPKNNVEYFVSQNGADQKMLKNQYFEADKSIKNNTEKTK